jgi:hypothetical protein
MAACKRELLAFLVEDGQVAVIGLLAYLIAIAFGGEPTPPRMLSGADVNMNS